MRIFCTFLLCFLFVFQLYAQGNDPVKDTLIFQTFEGSNDPADTMLTFPNGDDEHWVNYDQDNKQGRCVVGAPTPKGWYWESDLGFSNPQEANNDAFTSCSYLNSATPQNYNWLITAPVNIPDEGYWLCWRSLSYYGPDFMDGYKVLVSTSQNLPAMFTDTLFRAAQTLQTFQIGSLSLDDYTFSNGYIHANSYTDTAYFYVDYENNQPFYHGKLEPHSVSLSEYAGQTIYIAFLHDSYDDYQLQVDDILVTNMKTQVGALENFDYFNVMPNPVKGQAFVNWKSHAPEAGQIRITDGMGRQVFSQAFSPRTEGQVSFDSNDFQPGIYYCSIATASGTAVRKVVKQ